MAQLRVLVFAMAALVVTGTVRSEIIQATIGPYQVSLSDPVAIGESSTGLYESFLKVSNIGGDDAENPVTFNGTIGANGALHHEQFSAGPNIFPTPTGSDGGGVLDSYFTTEPILPIGPPAETDAENDSGETAQSGGFTAFGGVLSANVAYADSSNPAPMMVEIARLVFDPSNLPDYAFNIANPGGTTTFEGTFDLGGGQMDATIGDVRDDIDLGGGMISLQGAFDGLSGEELEAIMVMNENQGGAAPTITDLVIENETHPGLYSAAINDDPTKIDLFIDVALGGSQPEVVMATADLRVVTDFGPDLVYQLKATVPEPSTVALASLALVGLVGFARRK